MQRNPQNPLRKINSYDKTVADGSTNPDAHSLKTGIAGICSSCKTEVPSKPGFRPSTLKCPKCSKPLGGK
jgi:hypothetical protein